MMASKDAIYDAKVAAAAKATANANTIKQVGPSGGLSAGVIAGVNPPFIAETVIEPESTQWVKVSTIQTASGPVDVDANGLAADGSYPVAKVKSKLVSRYTDEVTGDIIDVYEDETEIIRKKGTKIIDDQKAADAAAAATLAKKVSAFDILRRSMKENGLETLADAAIDAINNEETDAGRLLALRSSPAYELRFGANDKRKLNGFAAIDEATYLELEDSYQSILQNYGMPAKYYARGELGVQQYFADAIAKNIDPTTFEQRIVEGVKIVNANKFVIDAAKEIYPTLNDGDFLDYVLNPENALSDIKRKVTAAEIGGAQLGAGLKVTASRAEELAKVTTGAKYQASATDIAEATLRGGQLANIYGQGPYTQQMAEDVQLDLPGSVESLKKTKKITGLEKATFGGQSGITGSALSRDRAGGY